MPVLFPSLVAAGRPMSPLIPEENQKFDPNECLERFQKRSLDSIRTAYEIDTSLRRTTSSGTLTTSLPEDVISLLYALSNVLDSCFLVETTNNELLNQEEEKVNYYCRGMLFVFQMVQQTQRSHRLLFLTTSLEDSCAAANDFSRMSEKLEILIQTELFEKHAKIFAPSRCDFSDAVLKEANDLVQLLLHDSVYAAERAQCFVMRMIQQTTTLHTDLFSTSWEDEFVHNECVWQMINILNLHVVQPMNTYLVNDFLYNKALVHCCKAIVCFYIRCLVQKADAVARKRQRNGQKAAANKRRITMKKNSHYQQQQREQPFHNPRRALLRMKDDIDVISNYFQNQAMDDAALTRILSNELWILKVIHECLSEIVLNKNNNNNNNNDDDDNDDDTSLESFIVVIHKRTGADAMVTRLFLHDLWLLVMASSSQNKKQMIKTTKAIHLAVNQIQPDLQMVTAGMRDCQLNQQQQQQNVKQLNPELPSFVQLDEMLKVLYEDRVAQGMVLPACWACLPKDVVGKAVTEEGEKDVVTIAKPIRKLTRNLAELKFIRHNHNHNHNHNNTNKLVKTKPATKNKDDHSPKRPKKMTAKLEMMD